MSLSEIDDTTKGIIAGILGFFGPKIWGLAKAIFDNPTAQQKKWDEHRKDHDTHTAEHGRVDGKFLAVFTQLDQIKLENGQLRERVSHLEGSIKDAA